MNTNTIIQIQILYMNIKKRQKFERNSIQLTAVRLGVQPAYCPVKVCTNTAPNAKTDTKTGTSAKTNMNVISSELP